MAGKTLPGRWPITGLCAGGLHEGEKHRNYRGQPMAFCRGRWVSVSPGMRPYEHVCACVCHEKITEMYEEFGRERPWPQSGKWWRDDDPGLVEQPKFWGPWNDPTWSVSRSDERRITASEVEKQRADEGTLTKEEERLRRAIEHKLVPPNPDYVAAVKSETSTEDELRYAAIKALGLTPKVDMPKQESRAARRPGQLEYEVKQVCDRWSLGLLPDVFVLTCAEIARAIDPDNPPSTGAITGVLIRWNEVGFAVHKKSPHRFEGYTSEGIELGVTELQRRQDRSLRTARAAKAREIRPRVRK